MHRGSVPMNTSNEVQGAVAGDSHTLTLGFQKASDWSVRAKSCQKLLSDAAGLLLWLHL